MLELLLALPVLGIVEFLNDMNFVIKIFVLLSIADFIRSNVGLGPLGIVLLAGVSYFILFDLWKIFGSIYLLYMLLLAGVGHMLIDVFITAGGHMAPPEEGGAGGIPAHPGPAMYHQAMRRRGGGGMHRPSI